MRNNKKSFELALEITKQIKSPNLKSKTENLLDNIHLLNQIQIESILLKNKRHSEMFSLLKKSSNKK